MYSIYQLHFCSKTLSLSHNRLDNNIVELTERIKLYFRIELILRVRTKEGPCIG